MSWASRRAWRERLESSAEVKVLGLASELRLLASYYRPDLRWGLVTLILLTLALVQASLGSQAGVALPVWAVLAGGGFGVFMRVQVSKRLFSSISGEGIPAVVRLGAGAGPEALQPVLIRPGEAVLLLNGSAAGDAIELPPRPVVLVGGLSGRIRGVELGDRGLVAGWSI